MYVNERTKLWQFLSFCAIVILGARAGILATTIILAGVYLVTRGVVGVLQLLFVLLTVGICILLFVPIVRERLLSMSEIFDLVNLDFDAANDSGSGGKRILFWLGSIQIGLDNPWTGIGLGTTNFKDNFPKEYSSLVSYEIYRPHNSFLYFFRQRVFWVFWFTLAFFGRAIYLLVGHFTRVKRKHKNVLLTSFFIHLHV